MNAFSGLLIVIAILISLLSIGVLIIWWKGINSIVFPGLGIIVGMPLLVVVLLIVEILIVVLAMFTKTPA